MSDDKRFLRKLKREIKQAGKRKLRRYRKNVDADADDFDDGRDRSDIMNEPKPRYANRLSGPARAPTEGCSPDVCRFDSCSGYFPIADCRFRIAEWKMSVNPISAIPRLGKQSEFDSRSVCTLVSPILLRFRNYPPSLARKLPS